MSINNRYTSLSIEDIIETTGTDNLKTIEEIEILFLHCDEIDSLQYCTSLKRFSMIDNGLQKISNVSYAKDTLLSLCLCDQNITKIENLDLPNLVELFLHRNQIQAVEGLNQCINLKKLWLNQNQITYISGLGSCSKLNELVLNDNLIPSLSGLDTCSELEILGLAANPITSLDHLDPLRQLPKLVDLTFYDIHFGKCPVTDIEGYREFVILNFRKLHYLDGVAINLNKVKAAEDAIKTTKHSFELSLRQIYAESEYELQNIEITHQAGSDTKTLIEDDVGLMLNELSSLIYDSRNMISKNITLQNQLFAHNYAALLHKTQAKSLTLINSIHVADKTMQTENDLANSLAYMLNMLTKADVTLREMFVKPRSPRNNLPSPSTLSRDSFPTATTNNNYNNSNTNGIIQNWLLQPISRKNPVYRKLSSYLSFNRLHDAENAPFATKSKQAITTSASRLMDLKSSELSSSTQNNGNGNNLNSSRSSSTDGNVELVTLYQLCQHEYESSSIATIQTSLHLINAFTIVSQKQLELLLSIQNGVSTDKTSSAGGSGSGSGSASAVVNSLSLVFFSDADLAVAALDCSDSFPTTISSSSSSSTTISSSSSSSSSSAHSPTEGGISSSNSNGNTNNNNNGSGNNNDDGNGDTAGSAIGGVYMRKAAQKKTLLLLCCHLEIDELFGRKDKDKDKDKDYGGSSSNERKLIFPPSKTGKMEMLSEIKSSNKPVSIPVELEQYISSSLGTDKNGHNNNNNNNNEGGKLRSASARNLQSNGVASSINQYTSTSSSSSSHIKDGRLSGSMYVIPGSYFHTNRAFLQLNMKVLFMGLCLSPPEPEGFDKTEHHIELLMTSISKSIKMRDQNLNNYEYYLENCYNNFMEQIGKDLLDQDIPLIALSSADLISGAGTGTGTGSSQQSLSSGASGSRSQQQSPRASGITNDNGVMSASSTATNGTLQQSNSGSGSGRQYRDRSSSGLLTRDRSDSKLRSSSSDRLGSINKKSIYSNSSVNGNRR